MNMLQIRVINSKIPTLLFTSNGQKSINDPMFFHEKEKMS